MRGGRFLMLLLLVLALPGHAEQPVEKCLPGSSCWARLQSVDGLGARTADVAKEVERLALRDPQLIELSRSIAVLADAMTAVGTTLLLRQEVDPANLKRTLASLRRRLVLIGQDDSGRYAGYGILIEEVRKLTEQIDTLIKQLAVTGEGDVDALIRAIESLASRLASLPAAHRPEAKDPDSANAGRSAPKISVYDRLTDVYGQNIDLRVAVMAVPDPRVPRYRRAFDLNIEATMRAMSAHGVHLDRFDFPWRRDQKRPCWPAGASESKDSGAPSCIDNGFEDLGLITFRTDCAFAAPEQQATFFCSSKDQAFGIVALYLVAERGADGPDQHAAKAALDMASVQAERASTRELGLIAPLNSSALGAWSKVVSGFSSSSLAFRWLSPTVTALNRQGQQSACDLRRYRTPHSSNGICLLAIPDSQRKQWLKERFGIHLSIFSENSRYGDGLNSKEGRVDRFTPGLWELQLQTQGVHSPAKSESRVLSRWERQFARELLFDDKDRGDEFPERYAHAVGARTQELAFNRIMQEYRASRRDGDRKPTVILASDVRDQLVVARALRVADPNAQLVFFDADELLGHAAYVGATRGAIIVPAGALDQCGADGQMHKFAKDEMALVFRAIHFWLDPNRASNRDRQCRKSDGSVNAQAHGSAVQNMLIVTREGLRGEGEHEVLRNQELAPYVAIATLLGFLLWWSNVSPVATYQIVASRIILRVGLSLIAVALGVLGLLSLFWGAHVGPGVSASAAGTMLFLALAITALTCRWAISATWARTAAPLLEPQALPTAPPALAAIFVAALGFALHLMVSATPFCVPIFSGKQCWEMAGPSFSSSDWLYKALPSMISLVSALALAMLALSFRSWVLLRADCAAAGIQFDPKVGVTWVGTTALPPFGTPYLAKLDSGLDAVAAQSPDLWGLINRRRILAADIAATRAWLHGSVVMSVFAVLAVQAYPMKGHASLLQLNLLTGLLGVGFALMLLVGMARNELLAALFTGKDKLEFGPRFISLIATAVLIGAGLLYLAIAPDGSEWYDDLFVPLLSWVRL